MKTLEEKAAALADRIVREVRKSAGKGLEKAVTFIAARVRETASVKAPTRKSKSGRIYATEKATPGAPLRVVTGRFFKSITSYMQDETTGIVGSNAHADIDESAKAFERIFGLKSEAGFNYPAFWELDDWEGHERAGGHKTFQPTIKKYLKEIGTIVGSEVKISLS